MLLLLWLMTAVTHGGEEVQQGANTRCMKIRKEYFPLTWCERSESEIATSKAKVRRSFCRIKVCIYLQLLTQITVHTVMVSISFPIKSESVQPLSFTSTAKVGSLAGTARCFKINKLNSPSTMKTWFFFFLTCVFTQYKQDLRNL